MSVGDVEARAFSEWHFHVSLYGPRGEDGLGRVWGWVRMELVVVGIGGGGGGGGVMAEVVVEVAVLTLAECDVL